jgi:hypothetical protein
VPTWLQTALQTSEIYDFENAAFRYGIVSDDNMHDVLSLHDFTTCKIILHASNGHYGPRQLA